MKRRGFAVVFGLLLAADLCEASTRSDVVNEAQGMAATDPWVVATNSHTWSIGTFTSIYDVGKTYTDWPYVYGGRETRATTQARIANQNVSPGGYNVNKNLTTAGIYNAYATDQSQWPTFFLAGVDCAGFVYGSLFGEDLIPSVQSKYTSAKTLANESARIDPSVVEIGDLFVLLPSKNGSSDHVQIVAAQRILDTLLLTLRPSFRDYPACGAQASCA